MQKIDIITDSGAFAASLTIGSRPRRVLVHPIFLDPVFLQATFAIDGTLCKCADALRIQLVAVLPCYFWFWLFHKIGQYKSYIQPPRAEPYQRFTQADRRLHQR